MLSKFADDVKLGKYLTAELYSKKKKNQSLGQEEPPKVQGREFKAPYLEEVAAGIIIGLGQTI